jgi:hypothetical protein
MPIKDGVTAIKEWREWELSHKTERRLPCRLVLLSSGIYVEIIAGIAVTGNARQAQIDSFYAAGFDSVRASDERWNLWTTVFSI